MSNFNLILPYLQDGEKVRRSYWPEGAYIRLDKGKILYTSPNIEECAASIGGGDLTATDWAVFKPKVETFGFEEALRRLKNGQKVRRAFWDDGTHVRNGYSTLVFVNTLGTTSFNARAVDLLADDWSVAL